MTSRPTYLCALLCLASWFFVPVVAAAQQAAKPALEITKDTDLDPAKTYGRIVIKASGIKIDGHGASVVGATKGDPKDYEDVGISAEGVSKVTLRNLTVKGWQTGLNVEDGSEWLIENCNFSDNFHAPAWMAWGDNNRKGGICSSASPTRRSASARPTMSGTPAAARLRRQCDRGERLLPHLEHLHLDVHRLPQPDPEEQSQLGAADQGRQGPCP